MKIKHLLGSALAAIVISAGMATSAVAGYAYSAMLNGRDPGSTVNLRSGPSTTTAPSSYGRVGDYVTVQSETQGTDGYTWFYVTYPSGAQGWVRGDFIAPDMRRM